MPFQRGDACFCKKGDHEVRIPPEYNSSGFLKRKKGEKVGRRGGMP